MIADLSIPLCPLTKEGLKFPIAPCDNVNVSNVDY